MSDRTSFYPELARDIVPARGKLGVLLPGLGAVSTTLVAGVHLIEKGLAKPFGSLTQMQSLRLGKRTQPRWKPIRELVPLAALSDLVFGSWDIFPDNAFEAARKAGVLSEEMLSAVRPELEALKPWPAVFEHSWVRNLEGTHKKSASTKMHLAQALMQDIDEFRKSARVDRCVMVWCGST
jgi:myo-inositol-1-phosphate synthase